MASQGNKLIFGTTFGYMEPMLKVAPDFADVKFEHATGYKTAGNMRTYDSRTYDCRTYDCRANDYLNFDDYFDINHNVDNNNRRIRSRS